MLDEKTADIQIDLGLTVPDIQIEITGVMGQTIVNNIIVRNGTVSKVQGTYDDYFLTLS